MVGQQQLEASRAEQSARLQGRKEGLAVAALALGLMSFLNLLGAEKAILALALGFAALTGATDAGVRKRAITAIALGVVYIITIFVVLMVFGSRFAELVEALQTLS